jgi:hypothetical protein
MDTTRSFPPLAKAGWGGWAVIKAVWGCPVDQTKGWAASNQGSTPKLTTVVQAAEAGPGQAQDPRRDA